MQPKVQIGVKIDLLLLNLWIPITYEPWLTNRKRSCFTMGMRVEAMGGAISLCKRLKRLSDIIGSSKLVQSKRRRSCLSGTICRSSGASFQSASSRVAQKARDKRIEQSKQRVEFSVQFARFLLCYQIMTAASTKQRNHDSLVASSALLSAPVLFNNSSNTN
jgi:hypothetical protein